VDGHRNGVDATAGGVDGDRNGVDATAGGVDGDRNGVDATAGGVDGDRVIEDRVSSKIGYACRSRPMRITGGHLRSRPLKAPKGTATRPTSDRVREALFNILSEECAGARVLDLYAGTGALGLEALSRGAIFAVFVERSKDALAALSANVRALAVENKTRVVALPAERAAKALGLENGEERFDLVFADPPYADVNNGAAVRVIEGIVRAAAIAPNGRLVVEHAQRDPSPVIEGVTLEQARTYGDTTLSFYSSAGS
jgi:16S rRNA (guanine966-N2)-methyltransferase